MGKVRWQGEKNKKLSNLKLLESKIDEMRNEHRYMYSQIPIYIHVPVLCRLLSIFIDFEWREKQ